MAKNKPKDLINIMLSAKVQTSTISSGVEILAQEVKEEEILLPLFKSLLRHINATVRESACSAIFSFYEDKPLPQEIEDRLLVMLNNDPSPVIKEYIQDMLKNFS